MPEPNNQNESGNEQDSKLLDLKPEELIGMIKDLRSENAKRRIDYKGVEEKLSAYEKEKAEADEKKKLDEGKKDELLREYKKKIETLEPKANDFEAYTKAKQEAAKDKLKDKWKESYSNLPLADLEELTDALTKKVEVADVEKGGGTPPKKISLTEEQKKDAQQKGLSEESYIELLADLEKKKIKY